MAKVEAKPEMKQPEIQKQPRIDEKLMKPGKYEVSNEHTFEVDVNLSQVENRWILNDRVGKGVDSHKVVFRMWNYDEMIDLKRKATSYDESWQVFTKLQTNIISHIIEEMNRVYEYNG